MSNEAIMRMLKAEKVSMLSYVSILKYRHTGSKSHVKICFIMPDNKYYQLEDCYHFIILSLVILLAVPKRIDTISMEISVFVF